MLFGFKWLGGDHVFWQCLGLQGEVLESLGCSYNLIFRRFTIPEVDTVIPAHGVVIP